MQRSLMSIGFIAVMSFLGGAAYVAASPAVAEASPPPDKPAASAPGKKLRIGVSIPAADHGWTAGVAWWAKRAMELNPQIEWSLVTALNPEKQVADIEDLMVKGLDGLVILATESAPLTPVAKKAHERGIFIVNVDRGFLEPVADIFIEGDNKAFGRKSAQYIVEKLGGKGNVAILEGIPCTVNTDRVSAAKEVFAQHPDIKVLASQPAMWNRQKALEVTENMLQRFPKIDCLWASDDDMALGAIQAIKEAGRGKGMFVFPGAGMKDVVKMVMEKDPLIPADITYPPSMIATGIHLCVSVLSGEKDKIMQYMPRHLMIDVELITPENAKQYYFPDSVY